MGMMTVIRSIPQNASSPINSAPLPCVEHIFAIGPTGACRGRMALRTQDIHTAPIFGDKKTGPEVCLRPCCIVLVQPVRCWI